jgi:hypothetical protein
MQEVALQFSWASRGVINGCIGALNGWILKIQKPRKSDGMGNAASFYSGKGYFSINVQVIVDKQKKLLFRSIKLRRAEHNSTAFKTTILYKWFLINWRELVSKGLHFIGDSAYPLKPFILIPYDNTAHGTPGDNYNFFHSSLYIAVECHFGKVDLWFGIFWRPLKFSLKANGHIIDACLWLHDFILENFNRSFMGSVDKEVFDEDCSHFLQYIRTSLKE